MILRWLSTLSTSPQIIMGVSFTSPALPGNTDARLSCGFNSELPTDASKLCYSEFSPTFTPTLTFLKITHGCLECNTSLSSSFLQSKLNLPSTLAVFANRVTIFLSTCIWNMHIFLGCITSDSSGQLTQSQVTLVHFCSLSQDTHPVLQALIAFWLEDPFAHLPASHCPSVLCSAALRIILCLWFDSFSHSHSWAPAQKPSMTSHYLLNF